MEESEGEVMADRQAMNNVVEELNILSGKIQKSVGCVPDRAYEYASRLMIVLELREANDLKKVDKILGGGEH